MPTSLIQQFLDIESLFFKALSQSPEEMDSFSQLWSCLHVQFEQTIQAGLVDSETMNIAHQVASRIEVIAQEFVQVDTLTTAFHRDMESIFQDLHIDDRHPEVLASASYQPHHRPSRSISTSLVLKPLHDWLLQNLHNPYPSLETKDILATKTQSTAKEIDSWFVDARKRIGWNALRKSHFSNKRRDIVEAATDYFIRNGLLNQASGSNTKVSRLDCDVLFATLHDLALGLYVEKFSESELAKTAGNTTFGSVLQSHVSPCDRKVQRQTSSKRVRNAAKSYPSPERSQSPEPILSSSSPPSRQKRRHSSQSSDYESDGGHVRFAKRTRLSSVDLPSRIAMPNLPSPAPSFSEIPLNIASSPAPSSSKKRKRCSSEGDDQVPMKRVHADLTSPLSAQLDYTLSATRSPDFDRWLEDSFGLDFVLSSEVPESVSLGIFDGLAPLEIEAHTFEPSSPSSTIVSSLDSPTSTLVSPGSSPVPGGLKYLEPQTQISDAWANDGSAEDYLSFQVDPVTWDLDLVFANAGDTQFAFSHDALGNVLSPLEITATPESIAPCWDHPPENRGLLSSPLYQPTSFYMPPTPKDIDYISLGTQSKEAKYRYLQSLLNEVQTLRTDLAL